MIRRFSRIFTLTDDERRWLEAVAGPHRTSSPRRDIIQQGRPIPFVAVVQDGWLFRYKRREDGRRQILNFVLPGDLVGLHRRVVPVGGHALQSITPTRLATMSDTQISALAAEQPRLADAMFRLSALELAMMHEHALRLGRMSARERVAHLLLELWTRLRCTGECNGTRFFFPLTQEMLADALGLSVMHIHRMLRDLQNEELISFEDRRLTLRDTGALAELAEFDPAYLGLNRNFALE